MSKKSKFDLSCELKTSLEIGQLIPSYFAEAVPGDDFYIQSNHHVRFDPLIAPLLHKVDLDTKYFFVPHRLIEKNFEKMLVSPDDPITVENLAKYYKNGLSIPDADLLRAFGINTTASHYSVSTLKRIAALPFKAYWLIVNYYYRNVLLDPHYIDDIEDIDWTTLPLSQLYTVNFNHDYFTGCFKDAQLGKEMLLDIDNDAKITVNEMRTAEKLQQYRERIMLSQRFKKGNKYTTHLIEFYNTAPDFGMLGIPLFLGGNTQTLDIDEIPQTSETTQNSPQGSPAGKIANNIYNESINLEVKEHGYIIGLSHIRPRQSYIAGIPREFIKDDYFSFFNPLFANLGLQEVYNCELDASRDGVFGYNYRFNELRQAKDLCCGNFMSEDFWHMSKDIRHEYLSNAMLKIDYRMFNRIFAFPSIYKKSKGFSPYIKPSYLMFIKDGVTVPDVNMTIYVLSFLKLSSSELNFLRSDPDNYYLNVFSVMQARGIDLSTPLYSLPALVENFDFWQAGQIQVSVSPLQGNLNDGLRVKYPQMYKNDVIYQVTRLNIENTKQSVLNPFDVDYYEVVVPLALPKSPSRTPSTAIYNDMNLEGDFLPLTDDGYIQSHDIVNHIKLVAYHKVSAIRLLPIYYNPSI